MVSPSSVFRVTSRPSTKERKFSSRFYVGRRRAPFWKLAMVTSRALVVLTVLL